MAWTSNGVDENGNLEQLGPATRAFRDHHAALVDVVPVIDGPSSGDQP